MAKGKPRFEGDRDNFLTDNELRGWLAFTFDWNRAAAHRGLDLEQKGVSYMDFYRWLRGDGVYIELHLSIMDAVETYKKARSAKRAAATTKRAATNTKNLEELLGGGEDK